jgi:hypothetical protein
METGTKFTFLNRWKSTFPYRGALFDTFNKLRGGKKHNIGIKENYTMKIKLKYVWVAIVDG